MNQLLHQHTESIVSAAIHAVLPDVAVVRALQGYRFGTGKIVLVAAGKAAWQMANAASDCLGNRIADGVVVTKYGHIKDRLPISAALRADTLSRMTALAGVRRQRLTLCRG